VPVTHLGNDKALGSDFLQLPVTVTARGLASSIKASAPEYIQTGRENRGPNWRSDKRSRLYAEMAGDPASEPIHELEHGDLRAIRIH
jgi:hypothetical protein